MSLAEFSVVDALYLIKWILGGFLAVAALLLAGACVLDVRERRRWRAMVPDCWPPPGAMHDEERRGRREEVSS